MTQNPSSSTATTPRWQMYLYALVFIGLVLRLAVGLTQDHRLGYTSDGGDTTWYLAHGYALVTNFETGILPDFYLNDDVDGYPIALSELPTPPLYLLFIGLPQALFDRETAVMIIRVIQAILSAATIALAAALAQQLTQNKRVALLTAAIVTFSPAFISEAARITSETLYIMLIVTALWLYMRNEQTPPPGKQYWLWLMVVAVLLGAATLTRAVLMLFPVGLAGHLFFIHRPRAALHRAIVLLTVYVLVTSTWTIYNLVRWDRLVIVAEGYSAFLYISAAGWDDPDKVDANVLAHSGADTITDDKRQELYQQAALNVISQDPVGYVKRRFSQLAGAYLQPHGTIQLSGPSLKQLASHWLRQDRSLTGLGTILQAESFWPKLTLYIFHYAALAAGMIGIWLLRGRWRWLLVMLGFITYTTLVHLLLDAIPRYLFPMEIFWYILAAYTLVWLANLTPRRQS